jgi:hypothetical protein
MRRCDTRLLAEETAQALADERRMNPVEHAQGSFHDQFLNFERPATRARAMRRRQQWVGQASP